MESESATKKQKIVDWIGKIQDDVLLDQISDFIQKNMNVFDPVYEATLSDKEKEEYWRKIGISGDETFDGVITHIKSLPWKK